MVDVPFGLHADAIYGHPTVVAASLAVGVGVMF
jgi:hypothetical protein